MWTPHTTIAFAPRNAVSRLLTEHAPVRCSPTSCLATYGPRYSIGNPSANSPFVESRCFVSEVNGKLAVWLSRFAQQYSWIQI